MINIVSLDNLIDATGKMRTVDEQGWSGHPSGRHVKILEEHYAAALETESVSQCGTHGF